MNYSTIYLPWEIRFLWLERAPAICNIDNTFQISSAFVCILCCLFKHTGNYNESKHYLPVVQGWTYNSITKMNEMLWLRCIFSPLELGYQPVTVNQPIGTGLSTCGGQAVRQVGSAVFSLCVSVYDYTEVCVSIIVPVITVSCSTVNVWWIIHYSACWLHCLMVILYTWVRVCVWM